MLSRTNPASNALPASLDHHPSREFLAEPFHARLTGVLLLKTSASVVRIKVGEWKP